MKTKAFYLLILITFLLLTYQQIKSQEFNCPGNCTTYEFQFVPNIPECDALRNGEPIIVTYCCCFSADPLRYTVYPTIVRWPNYFYRNCIMNNQTNKENFIRQLADKLWEEATLRGCLSSIPPCGDPSTIPIMVSIRIAQCWKDINFWSSSWYEWILTSVRCPNTTAECDYWYQICLDFFARRIIVLSSGCNMIGNDNCSFEVPTLPPPGKTDTEPWETECYAWPCCP